MAIQAETAVIFEPIALPENYQFELPADAREINIPVDQSIMLNGILFESKKDNLLLLYFQGNAKNLQNWLDNHSMVLDWGYNVLVTDYRGFGKSGGSLTGETQMYTDAKKVYEYAISLGYKPENMVLYGYSMGTAMACYLARVKQAKALILESPFSSIAEVTWVGDKAPSYPLDSKRHAKSIEAPTLIIHGDKDDVITPDHARRIFDNLATPLKKMTIIPGGGHGDLRSRPEYKSLITEFLGGPGFSCSTKD
jgi:pimeloyl-ACP methyl ester carboxylesterase